MPRVLVVDGDAHRRAVLDRLLAQDGHEPALTASVTGAAELLRDGRPDLVLTGWDLEDGAAPALVELLQRSHRAPQAVPFVFVTPRGDEADRIRGFELGAADYVVEPWSARELLRLRAVLRRSEGAPRGRAVDLGCLRIDPAAYRVWVDGREIDLTLLEWKLLHALYENRERVQTRAELLDRAWGGDVSITTRTVDTHIKRLRDKLLRAGEYVQTVRGIGYRFAVPPR